MKNFFLKIIIKQGKKTIQTWESVKDFLGYIVLIVKSFRSLKYLSFRSLYTTILDQTKFTGIDAIRLIVWAAVLLGATVIIQATQNFPKFGIDAFVGNLMILIIARELGPLLTAIIVISRSGSAMASEIATQTENKEIRALELMGIDTKLYIVFPRIVASIVSIFTLIILFDIVAFIGGYAVSLISVYIPFGQFVTSLMEAFSFEDLAITVLKSVIYGILIPLICSYYGFKPASSFQIPIFVSKAVVRTLLYIFIINALISVLFYM
ncbi:MAG: ABC transporter permease [Spirochaetes bacterium]|nr:ABC transporter permease [Spirochaetota bacterium]